MNTYETPEPITITLELAVADVTITASNRTDTVVEIAPTNPASRADVAAAEQTRVEYVDGRLTVTGKSWRQWRPWRGRESVDVHIAAPSGSHVFGNAGVANLRCAGRVGEVRFTTAAGSARIDDCGPAELNVVAGDIDLAYSTGPVDAHASSGSVRIGWVEGDVTVKNSNGATSVQEVAGELRARSANGNVAVEHAHGNVVAKTANGNVRVGRADGGTVVGETSRGNVEVGVRGGLAAWLDLNTSFGRVDNELDAAAAPEPGGPTIEVRARTAFGNITIRRAPAHDPADV